jgi:hypothetical protein
MKHELLENQSIRGVFSFKFECTSYEDDEVVGKRILNTEVNVRNFKNIDTNDFSGLNFQKTLGRGI